MAQLQESTITTTVAGRYSLLEAARKPFLTRAEECSALTIPSLITKVGHTSFSQLPTPYQGLGARGVNNLASKLLLALLPPNSPFFKLTIDDMTLEKMTRQEGMRGEVEKAFGSIERTIMMEIETTSLRVSLFEALKHLIVAGNVLLYLPPLGGTMRVFHMNRFVVKRDPSGTVLEIITKEAVSPDVLDGLQKFSNGESQGITIDDTGFLNSSSSSANRVDKSVDIFTIIRRVPTENPKGKQESANWETWQEIRGKEVKGTRGTFPLDKSPWIPLRFTKIDGEDYGRSYVEEYLGDIRSLEGLTKAIVQGAAAASKVIFLVNPNGTTQEETLATAPNGAIRTGNREDVSVLQTEKYADFRIAFETINRIDQRLSYAFLMNSAIQRSGERVTAEEIRYLAGELEAALGGVYAILSQELQLPLVNRLIFQLEQQGRLPVLPKGIVKPMITTGIEALGRGNDLSKLDSFIGGVTQQFGPQALAQYVKIGEYLNRRGTSLGIDMKGLIKSEQEIAEEMQQQQMMAMAQQMGPNAITQIGQVAKENIKEGNS